MDPLTALSLAGNVIQLVDFSLKGARACKELYDAGSLDTNNVLEKSAEEIVEANKTLQDALKRRRSAGKPNRLEQVATDVSKTADGLKIALNKLKLSKSQGLRKLGGAFKVTLKTLVNNGTIKRLEQELEAQERILQSGLVKEI